MADNGKDDTICPICSKGYKAYGDNIPKFLPCSHTVCEKCIKRKLLKRDHLDCPQCPGLHFAHDGVGTFPTNKYVLMYIEAKAEKSGINVTRSRYVTSALFRSSFRRYTEQRNYIKLWVLPVLALR